MMHRAARSLVLLSLAAIGAVPPAAAEPQSPAHLKLIDPLDRPRDGYCVDVPGTGPNLRIDLPLFAHNCKPALTADSAVKLTAKGRIRFPTVDRCMTVAGVNSGALPGASILLRGCGESSPFFETAALQRFVLHDDGRLTLADTDLCLVVGPRSASTYSPADRWRALFVDDCGAADPKRARWQFAAPGNGQR